MSEAKTTTDHAEIKRWVEARKGRPSIVEATEGKGGGGILRIDFQEKDEALDEVDWDAFFEVFDKNKLAFLHQDKTKDGSESRFNRFVHRE